MNGSAVCCSRCQDRLDHPAFYNSSTLQDCPSCGAPLQIAIFPALFREPERGPQAETLVEEGQSSCYYHPQKKAMVPCDICGRFLCALCDVELSGQHLCPVCLEKGQQKRTLVQLENRRVRYDKLALIMALVPLLVWPFTLLTAPGTVFFALRHWNSPPSLVGQTRLRLVLALLIGLLEIAGWALGLYYAFHH